MLISSKIWQHCDKCHKAITYRPDPKDLETREQSSKELVIRIAEHQIHLCTTCDKHFAECHSNPVFGNCVGNDNVIECDSYKEV